MSQITRTKLLSMFCIILYITCSSISLQNIQSLRSFSIPQTSSIDKSPTNYDHQLDFPQLFSTMVTNSHDTHNTRVIIEGHENAGYSWDRSPYQRH